MSFPPQPPQQNEPPQPPQPTQFCRSCGAQLNAQAVVCVQCGVATGVATPNIGAPAAAQPQASGGISGLDIAGYILAVIIPLVGFILGIVSAVKHKGQGTNHGVFIIIVSVVAFIFWLVILSSGGSDSASYSTYSY